MTGVQTCALPILQQVLTSIVSNILQISTTFTAPTVAVNAFNRTQTLNDLYVSVFQPATNYHWPGNLKRYLLKNGVIVDANESVLSTFGYAHDELVGTLRDTSPADSTGFSVTRAARSNRLHSSAPRVIWRPGTASFHCSGR